MVAASQTAPGAAWAIRGSVSSTVSGGMSCGIISGAMLPTEPGGAPEFGLEGKVVICPRHRWKFSIETGESLYAVDRRRLVPFPVRVEGDRLLIGVRRRAPSASADAA